MTGREMNTVKYEWGKKCTPEFICNIAAEQGWVVYVIRLLLYVASSDKHLYVFMLQWAIMLYSVEDGADMYLVK